MDFKEYYYGYTNTTSEYYSNKDHNYLPDWLSRHNHEQR